MNGTLLMLTVKEELLRQYDEGSAKSKLTQQNEV
jgi:hypothetical protein